MNHITTRDLSVRVTLALAGVGLAIIIGAPVRAQDYTIGPNARAFAMGGAGIALSQSNGPEGRTNPASLAFERNTVAPSFPSFGLRAQGPVNSNTGGSYLFNGMQSADAISLAGTDGTANSTFGINGYSALRIDKFEVSADAVGVSHLLPNEAWANWVQTGGGLLNTLPDNAKADLYSGGYYTLPAVAYANSLPTTYMGDRVAIGLRVKDMIGVYDHTIVEPTFDPTVNHTTLVAVQGAEMRGQNELKESGAGADVGILLRPKAGTGLSFGVVAGNIVNPGIKFASLDATGKTVNEINLVQTTLSAGLGYETRFGFTMAADMVNIGGGNDLEGSPTQDARIGAEQRFLKGMALRGGYSKLNGFSYGFGVFGVDVALGQKAPLEIIHTLNF